MMPLWRPGTPLGGDPSGHDEYLMWDAAYVLGSLSSAEWREFEAHLASCPLCPGAVGEISGMPALLSQLDRVDVAATDVADRIGLPVPPDELLPALLAKTRWRRRRSRIAAWTAGTVAAAVLTTGVLVGVAGGSPASLPTPASVSAQPMAQVGTSSLTSTVSVSGERWGTSISMNCVCLAPLSAHHDTLAMVAVARDGSRTRMATWAANPGHAATPTGSISTPVDQIVSVQVISADDGRVLLERSL